MNTTQSSSAGYFIITVNAAHTRHLFSSNNERAFIVSQLQDILGVRSLLEEPTARYRLAAHIDLLAYSIQPHCIQLVVFSIAQSSARTLANIITSRLEMYQSEWKTPTTGAGDPPHHHIDIKQLDGPHSALQHSVKLHLEHTDWEHDRYSSIGFYLHDRRGDWMRIWRLAHLYDNNTEYYYQLLTGTVFTESPAPLMHA